MQKNSRLQFNLLFYSLILLTIGCGVPEEKTKEEPEKPFRPNILWLVAEDLSPYLPMYGDSTITTPTLSKLADEGIVFTNVYSPSGVCAPSRYALSTGRYPIADGANNMRNQGSKGYMGKYGFGPYEVVPPPEVKMMSQVLREHGYFTSNNAKEDYQYQPVVTAWDQRGGQAHWRNRKPGQPFFSIFNFEVTHESQFFNKPSSGKLRYFVKEPFLRKGEQADSSLWNYELPDSTPLAIPPYLPDNDITRSDMLTMYKNIQIMDRQVQVVLDQLEEDGLLDSTIVIWYSDHGGPLPRQKRLMYESGLKLPMIIRYPEKMKAGSFDDQLISFVDFAPTVFSMAGIEPPEYLHGQAFAGKYSVQNEREFIHAGSDRLDAFYDRIRAVKNDRYKYLRNYYPEKPYYLPLTYRENISTMQELLRMNEEGKLNEFQAQWFRKTKPEEELFDTWEDPHELTNLAEDPEYQEILEELRAECDRWLEEVGDYHEMNEKDIREEFWPGSEQPICETPIILTDENTWSITCSDPGCSIGYQILEEGQEPGNVWSPYTGPIPLEKGKKIAAISDRIGYKPSEMVVK